MQFAVQMANFAVIRVLYATPRTDIVNSRFLLKPVIFIILFSLDDKLSENKELQPSWLKYQWPRDSIIRLHESNATINVYSLMLFEFFTEKNALRAIKLRGVISA